MDSVKTIQEKNWAILKYGSLERKLVMDVREIVMEHGANNEILTKELLAHWNIYYLRDTSENVQRIGIHLDNEIITIDFNFRIDF